MHRSSMRAERSTPLTMSTTASAATDTADRTGVEMEALTGATVALLTIYDMWKAMDKGMTIGGVYLRSKTGGKSGPFENSGPRGE